MPGLATETPLGEDKPRMARPRFPKNEARSRSPVPRLPTGHASRSPPPRRGQNSPDPKQGSTRANNSKHGQMTHAKNLVDDANNVDNSNIKISVVPPKGPDQDDDVVKQASPVGQVKKQTLHGRNGAALCPSSAQLNNEVSNTTSLEDSNNQHQENHETKSRKSTLSMHSIGENDDQLNDGVNGSEKLLGRIPRAGRTGRALGQQDNSLARAASSSPPRSIPSKNLNRTRSMSNSSSHKRPSSNNLQRAHTHDGQAPRTSELGQNATLESNIVGSVSNVASELPDKESRKPSMAPVQQATPKQKQLRVRAESLLDHSLLLGGSTSQLDMSESISDATGVIQAGRRSANSISSSARMSVSQRSTASQRRKSTTRTTSSTGEKNRQPKSPHKNLPENVGKECRSASPEDRSNCVNRATDTVNTLPSQHTSPAKGRANKSSRPETTAPGIRRARSMTRAADPKNSEDGHPTVTVEHVKTVLNAAHNSLKHSNKRAVSYSPPRPVSTQPLPRSTAPSMSTSPSLGGDRHRSVSGGRHRRASPSATSRARSTSPSRRDCDGSPSGRSRRRTSTSSKSSARSKSPSQRRRDRDEDYSGHTRRRVSISSTSRARPTSPSQRGDRDGSPTGGRTKTTSPSSSPRSRRPSPTRQINPTSRSEKPSASPSSSSYHRRTSPSRDKEPMTPTAQDRPTLAPPTGSTKRESMTLANVFDLLSSTGLDPATDDSSVSEATDGDNSTVLQFDPVSMDSVTSFKRDASCASLDNSGVFKMESLNEKKKTEEMGDGSGGSYLPKGIVMAQKPKSRGSRDGQTLRPQSRRSSNRQRSPYGDREREADCGRRNSLERRESLTIDAVFAEASASPTMLRRSKPTRGNHDSASSFRGHESDSSKSKIRRKRQEKLNHKQGDRDGGEDGDIIASSAYLPSHITGRNLTPPGSPSRPAASNRGMSPRNSLSHSRQSRSPSRIGGQRIGHRMNLPPEVPTDDSEDTKDVAASTDTSADEYSDDREGEHEREPSRKSKKEKALTFVKSHLLSLKGKVMRESGHCSPTRAEPNEETSSDFHSRKSSSNSDKSVGKKLKGLFGKSGQKQHQILGSGESDSDYSFDGLNK